MKATKANTCRLTLEINGTAYAVRRIEAEEPAWRLRKADRTVYDLIHTEHGYECSCADYEFRHSGHDDYGCKHVRALRACGLLGRG